MSNGIDRGQPVGYPIDLFLANFFGKKNAETKVEKSFFAKLLNQKKAARKMLVSTLSTLFK
jgi:hypothetical protein